MPNNSNQNSKRHLNNNVSLLSGMLKKTLPEILSEIEKELKPSSSVLKRLYVLNKIRDYIETDYTTYEITNINEYSETVVIGNKPIELCLITPSQKTSHASSTNPLYGNTINSDLIEIFASYLESGAKECYRSLRLLRKRIREKRKIKSSLTALVDKSFKRVDFGDLLQDIKVRKLEDVIPAKAYLVPNTNSEYSGYTYVNDSFPLIINVRAIISDKIFANNPLRPNSVTAAHEIAHSKVQTLDRLFHVENLTRYIDFMAKNKSTFLFELLFHPYTYETSLLDIIDIYLDDKILPLFKSLRGREWYLDSSEIFWDKTLLKQSRKIEKRIEELRPKLIKLLKESEADYYSLDKYGLDTLINLTNMPSMPLWLTASKMFKPNLKTTEFRDKFYRRYERSITSISKKLKNEFFDSMRESGTFENSYTIKDSFFDELNSYFTLSLDEKKLAWDLFVRSFTLNDQTKFHFIYPKDVLETVNIYSSRAFEVLESTNLETHQAQKIIDQLQLYDYLKLRLNLADSIHGCQEKNKEEFFSSEILLPKHDLLKDIGIYNPLNSMLQKSLKKKSFKIKLPNLHGSSDFEYKITKHFYESNLIAISVYQVGDKSNSILALLLSSRGDSIFDILLYSSVKDKNLPGHGVLDNFRYNELGYTTIPFEEILSKEYNSYYLEGKEIYSKLDWVRKHKPKLL
ncbi:hypothetical protein D6777_03165 [Candidatus Woesearchaeota archaeon]|nr:MAG: hypothetical protein D6777_03165 [Candidatus Woesearchaeota archaeon]